MLASVALIGCSYLFGSLPSTVALARISGLDLPQEGDLHAVLWRKVSKIRGSLAIAIDFYKGIIPILIAFGFNLTPIVVASSGVAAVAGQMWPVFCNFDGEKGNSIGVAVIITLALTYRAWPILFFLIPLVVGAAMRFFFSLFSSDEPLSERLKFRESSDPIVLGFPVSMILGFAVAPLASWCSGQPLGITLSLLALFVVIVVRRLTAGLKADLEMASSVIKILINRFLFDRSHLGGDKN